VLWNGGTLFDKRRNQSMLKDPEEALKDALATKDKDEETVTEKDRSVPFKSRTGGALTIVAGIPRSDRGR
jgi:hypothetical protein